MTGETTVQNVRLYTTDVQKPPELSLHPRPLYSLTPNTRNHQREKSTGTEKEQWGNDTVINTVYETNPENARRNEYQMSDKVMGWEELKSNSKPETPQ